jgi:hypothetical protein
MDITIEKTGIIARSYAYQAVSKIECLELASCYGANKEEALQGLIKEIKMIHSEIDDFLTLIHEVRDCKGYAVIIDDELTEQTYT